MLDQSVHASILHDKSFYKTLPSGNSQDARSLGGVRDSWPNKCSSNAICVANVEYPMYASHRLRLALAVF